MGFLDPKPAMRHLLDADVAGKINTPSSQTAAALSATIDTQVSAGTAAAQLAKIAYRAALTSRNTSNARTVIIGSSSVAGNNAVVKSANMVNRYAALLQNAYNPVGVDGGWYCPALEVSEPSWVTTGTTGEVTEGFNMRARSMSASATLTRTFEDTDGFTVYFARGASATPFTVSIDGGAPITVTPSTAGTGWVYDGQWVSDTLVRGAHTLKITATGATRLDGVFVHRGDKLQGVQVFGCGKSSTRVSSWLGLAAADHRERLAHLGPKRIMLVFGSNDYRDQLSPAGTTANLLTLMDEQIAALGYTPSYALVAQAKPFDVTNPTYPYSSYVAAIKAAAEERPAYATFIDMTPAYPQSQAEDVWNIIDSDDIHPTSFGQLYSGEVLAEFDGVPSGKSARVTPPEALVRTVIASDGFSGADVAGIAGRVTDSAFGGTAKTWEATDSTAFNINSNQLARGANVTSFAGIPVTNADCELAITVIDITGAGPNILRSLDVRRSALSATGVSLYRVLYGTDGAMILRKSVAGTSTDLGSVPAGTLRNGARLAIRAIGSRISVVVDGVAVISVTDSSVTTSAYAGITTSSTVVGLRVDDMVLTEVALP